jgi:DNA-binding transcriptional MerR regulator
MTEEKVDSYMTVGKAAGFLGVSSATLRNWDRAGKLIAYRHPMNGYRLYSRRDLERVLSGIKQHEQFNKG